MGIAARVTLLFFCAGLLLSTAFAVLLAQREYQTTLDEIAEQARLHTQNRVDLQFYIYGGATAGLDRILEEFIGHDAISGAAVYSSQGKLLSRVTRGAASSKGAAVELSTIRGKAAISDSSLTALDGSNAVSGTGFWTSLIADRAPAYLVTPVFTSVNPLKPGQLLADFAYALEYPDANHSLVVIGYVCLVIDRSTILLQSRSAATTIFLLGCTGTALCAVLLLLVLKRILLPLSRLKLAATQLTQGANYQPLYFPEHSEFSAIAELLNSALEREKNYRSEIGLEHKLLQMKADERASLLSMRERELSKAAEEINTAREQLHRLANYDRLTSLPNRQLFAEQLGVLLRLCARHARPLALLFINLNNFHRINESLGRATGDAILQEVAKRLESCLRSSDILAHHVNPTDGLRLSRLGGDEFAIVLNELDDIESAGLVAQRITDRLTETMEIDGHELVITPRIGIAVAPRNAMDVEGLLKAAGIAMHQVKSTNNASYLYYNDEMDAGGQDEIRMEAELRKAIERNELSLHFQPQVDTSNGSIICAEALLRWEHPEYGFVAPSKFIALAERMDFIRELGDWVLLAACRQMKEFQQQKLQLKRIAINISAQQFKPALVSRVREVLADVGLPASMLELGLSEAILASREQVGLQIIHDLKALGVFLSLDNFGTNNAPISYLGRYPLDEIKIDRSFVSDCNKRQDAGRLVKAIIAMASSLELRTVAEGVETEAEYRFLAGNGVQIMRGYLFSKPLPAVQFTQLLVVPWHFMSQIQRMALTEKLRITDG